MQKHIIYKSCFPSLAALSRCFELDTLYNHPVPHLHLMHHDAAAHQLIVVQDLCTFRFLTFALLFKGTRPQRSQMRMTHSIIDGSADIEVVFGFGVDANLVGYVE